MPYLKPENKRRLESTVATLRRALGYTSPEELPGVLNYLISQIVVTRINAQGKSYHLFNEIIGALECAKLEIYRRLIAGYEAEKIVENGDVFF